MYKYIYMCDSWNTHYETLSILKVMGFSKVATAFCRHARSRIQPETPYQAGMASGKDPLGILFVT